MTVEIPKALTDLASSINIEADMPNKRSFARNRKINQVGSKYASYLVEMDFSILTEEQADELIGLINYSNSTGDVLALRLGYRADNPTLGSIAVNTAGVKGDTEILVNHADLSSVKGRYFKFSGHSKMYQVAFVTQSAPGVQLVRFSPPLREPENGTLDFHDFLFTALPEPKIMDSAVGGTGRSANLKLMEFV